ncbi:hypothetical protein KX729_27270 [Rhizobium sp. XQZ8]|uniref:hypothetical protein n=1 Tax=Rhizobium populisoli TaxID=2859785 RepID=UPI001CA5B4B4|nr:hypothetical protein [Rhizobium populisoli]MBW6425150.1 hypothetical protein [Rhizobium populisoli]
MCGTQQQDGGKAADANELEKTRQAPDLQNDYGGYSLETLVSGEKTWLQSGEGCGAFDLGATPQPIIAQEELCTMTAHQAKAL